MAPPAGLAIGRALVGCGATVLGVSPPGTDVGDVAFAAEVGVGDAEGVQAALPNTTNANVAANITTVNNGSGKPLLRVGSKQNLFKIRHLLKRLKAPHTIISFFRVKSSRILITYRKLGK